MLDRTPPTAFHRPMRAGGALKPSPPILALLVLASLPAPQAKAETPSTRTYSVTSFDRIRIDGPYKVALKTNMSPFARATGTFLALEGVSIGVEGRTLIIRKGSGGWGGYSGEQRGPVTIEVGTHDLGTAWINGAGALSVDQVKGMTFDLVISGPGVLQVDRLEVDQLKAGISGAGTAQLSGSAAKLAATIKGTSAFAGEQLRVKDAMINTTGTATVRATVTDTAKVIAVGLASIELAGNPACTVTAKGSAVVSGCKEQN